MRIVLTGGGTGGHIYPALTIADEVRRQAPAVEFLYVGTAGGLEADLVPRAGLPFAAIAAGGLVRTSPVQMLRGALRMAAGVWQAIGILRRFRPRAVLATGGYVSGPVLLAARLLGVPYLLWEGNAFPGSTVRLFSRWAAATFIPYPESRRYFPPRARLLCVGNPVRREVLAADRDQARAALGYGPADQVVLVAGGSQGARGIHQALAQAAPRLLARPAVRLLVATGPRQYEAVVDLWRQQGIDPLAHPAVRLERYIYDMPQALAAADVGVFRAGATTCAEVAARGLPAVLVPFPYATHNHQEYNARALERRGGAVVILERDLTGPALAAALLGLLDDPQRRQAMARALQEAAWPRAGEEIARRLLAVAGGGTAGGS